MIGSALEDLDLSAVLAEFRSSQRSTGTRPRPTPSGRSVALPTRSTAGRELRDVMMPGDRQNLDVAYRRSAARGLRARHHAEDPH
jgi:hypothetical protein